MNKDMYEIFGKKFVDNKRCITLSFGAYKSLDEAKIKLSQLKDSKKDFTFFYTLIKDNDFIDDR